MELSAQTPVFGGSDYLVTVCFFFCLSFYHVENDFEKHVQLASQFRLKCILLFETVALTKETKKSVNVDRPTQKTCFNNFHNRVYRI